MTCNDRDEAMNFRNGHDFFPFLSRISDRNKFLFSFLIWRSDKMRNLGLAMGIALFFF